MSSRPPLSSTDPPTELLGFGPLPVTRVPATLEITAEAHVQAVSVGHDGTDASRASWCPICLRNARPRRCSCGRLPMVLLRRRALMPRSQEAFVPWQRM
jgi:hypothetical protein